MIPLSVPNLKGNELSYVTEALRTEWVSTAGSFVTRFELEMMQYLNVKGTLALQSGTAGIHLALILAGVSSKDEVIVPTLTFIAAVNPVKYVGAEPIFMDCDDSLNMDCDKLEQFLQQECILTLKGLQNKITKRIIKAVIVVHVFGNMANLERLRDLADQYEIKLIEDATEALGTYCTKGRYKGKFAGTIGDFGAYSFNGNKIITTGGGGMLTARDISSLEKARYLAAQAKDNLLYYIHNEVGYNYRMTNLQAALGVAQLEKLEVFIQNKTSNYEYYFKFIKEMKDFYLLNFNPNARNNHWFYSLCIQNETVNRDTVMIQLKDNQIETRPIWQLIHSQRMYTNNQTYYIEKANYYLERVINLPCSSNLLTKDIDYIINVIKNCSS
ncbi:MAG: LegC family aminotransferase [Lachnotalea sp.]